MAKRYSFIFLGTIEYISSIALNRIQHIFNHNLYIIFFPFLLASLFLSSFFFLLVGKRRGHFNYYWTNLSSFFCVCIIKQQSLLSNIGTVETKRGCTLMESKVSQSQTALKKSRSSSESRPSCPPFKVPYLSWDKNKLIYRI